MTFAACVGFNGSGKSLLAVERYALPALSAGLPVLSNLRLHEVIEGERAGVHPLSQHLVDPAQLFAFRDGLLLLDDIGSLFSSRDSRSMPATVLARLQALRHYGVSCVWTAPAWARADLILRECTREVWSCSGYLGKLPHDGAQWRENRLFRFKRYRADDFEEFTRAKEAHEGKGRLRASERLWYRRAQHEAHLVYDTYADIALLAPYDDYGNCPQCQGSRPRPRCSCDHGEPRSRPASVAAGSSGAAVSAADGAGSGPGARLVFRPGPSPVTTSS